MSQHPLSTPGPTALAGIRVLDLTRALAGPWCTQNLGDLGAEVIKVERPDQGDESRAWGPPWLKDATGSDTSESSYFLSCNRNKKSVTIDLATAAGQEDIRRLAAACDILVENYKVGQLQKYGLDHASLKQINPSLIYCSITGFGQNGPWAHRPGYDMVGQGMSGFMSVTGERDGLPGAGPQKGGIAVADLFTGMYATVAVLAALHHRARTGEGQYIDISLLDCMVAAMANMNTSFLASGMVPKRYGNAHQSVVPYGVFETLDGHLILAIANDGQYQKFCAAAGHAHLASDPRFVTNSRRVEQRSHLLPVVEDIMRQLRREEWIERLDAVGVPCAPIYDVDEALNNPQILARGLRFEIPHATGATAQLVGNPMKFSATPVSYRLAPPLLGAHNEELLGGR
jgi:crotonobetainyl-CoA:carnitine CoA-transferase CaiB-like acyl-CoA transferase